MLRNPADDHTLLVFDPKIKRQDGPLHLQVQEAALSKPSRATAEFGRAKLSRLLCTGALVLGLVAGMFSGHLAGGVRETRSPRRPSSAPLAQRAQDDGHPAGRGVAGRRHRARRRGRAGGSDRRPVGAVDRGHLHRFGHCRRGLRHCCWCIFPAVRETRRHCSRLPSPGRAKSAAPLPGAERVLQKRRSIQRRRRGEQWRCLPLTSSRVLFALALTRIWRSGRRRSSPFSTGSRDALLVVIGWVLPRAAGRFAFGFYRRLGSGRGGIRGAWPLCGDHLAGRHCRHARSLSVGDRGWPRIGQASSCAGLLPRRPLPSPRARPLPPFRQC